MKQVPQNLQGQLPQHNKQCMNTFPLLKPLLHYCSSWELKERSLSLAKSSLLCMLVHSNPLYAWAVNLRASTFYRAYNPSMAPWWIPCGTTTTRSCSNLQALNQETQVCWILSGISHREWPLHTCWDYWELKDQWSFQFLEHWMKDCHLQLSNFQNLLQVQYLSLTFNV